MQNKLCLGEQQRLRDFAIENDRRVLATASQETIDLWQLPGKDERPPATLGVPLRTITLSISSVTQLPVLLTKDDSIGSVGMRCEQEAACEI